MKMWLVGDSGFLFQEGCSFYVGFNAAEIRILLLYSDSMRVCRRSLIAFCWVS